MISISRAVTTEHFQVMEAFGREVIPDVYVPYFPREWADYLVETGHTVPALEGQAAAGYRHYLVFSENELAGYFAVHERGDGVMVLSHLYLREDFRGMGLGQVIMDFVHRDAAECGVRGIELVVLRANRGAVSFYQRHGYVIEREVLTPMGPGAELEDYVMRKEMGGQGA